MQEHATSQESVQVAKGQYSSIFPNTCQKIIFLVTTFFARGNAAQIFSEKILFINISSNFNKGVLLINMF
jgi:hypothetical protein